MLKGHAQIPNDFWFYKGYFFLLRTDSQYMLKLIYEATLHRGQEKDCDLLLKNQKRVLEAVTILFSVSSYTSPPHSEVQIT